MPKYTFSHAILGGTFDHFHIGHKSLIDTALSMSQKVTIGVATEELYKNKSFSHTIEDFQTREKSLITYLTSKKILNRVSILAIDDFYGNTLTEQNIDAIFTTEDTLTNVRKINRKRKERGLTTLKIITIPYVTGDDDRPVSSSRIRMGEIDREGHSYFNMFAKKKHLKVARGLKKDLRVPLGRYVKDMRRVKKFLNNNSLLISIGDIVTLNLFMMGVRSDIAIFDFRTRRHKISKEYFDILTSFDKCSVKHTAINPPGMIERRAVGVIRRALHSYMETGEKQIISIKGEEDLLTIPTILLSPLGSTILYGQSGLGTVIVQVTEKKKKEVVKLLDGFI